MSWLTYHKGIYYTPEFRIQQNRYQRVVKLRGVASKFLRKFSLLVAIIIHTGYDLFLTSQS